MNLVFSIVANALALLGTAYLVPGIMVQNFMDAFIAAIVLGLLNTFLRPFLEILSLPVTIITFGLFSWVISALVLWITSLLVPGFEVAGFIPALVGGIVVAFFASLIQSLLKR